MKYNYVMVTKIAFLVLSFMDTYTYIVMSADCIMIKYLTP